MHDTISLDHNQIPTLNGKDKYLLFNIDEYKRISQIYTFLMEGLDLLAAIREGVHVLAHTEDTQNNTVGTGFKYASGRN